MLNSSQTSSYKTLFHVVGARPNFMKLAPVFLGLQGAFNQKIIHTGQHYDRRMSGDFFDILGLPEPDLNLGVGSGTHAEQTAKVMLGLEPIFAEHRPRAVVLYGDVNSTLSGALVAAKLHIPIIHVEAGLRARDRTMPEEQNRVVTDQLADILLTHSEEADDNLRAEGVAQERIHFVGNVMIDTLARMMPAIEAATLPLEFSDKFALVTLHRPSNVDDPVTLARVAKHLEEMSRQISIVFPVHPRTRAKLADLNFAPPKDRVTLIDPQDYVNFVALQKRATLVLTDSGGVQEETTYLGTPCLTLRPNTERPVTIEVGTNTLIGDDPAAIIPHVQRILAGDYKKGGLPKYWDGATSTRIRDLLVELL